MQDLKNKALSLGATDFGTSNRMNKRFYVVYDKKIVHFGSHKAKTFLEHKDDKKRDAWYARHSKIKNKNGQVVINLKTSPSYWSAHILWPK
jgi:hypothetical protein